VGISPFAERSLDEALGLAVGLWRVRSGSDVFEAESLASVSEGKGFVAGAVVSHDALNAQTEAGIEGDGGTQESDGTGLGFIWQDVSEADAGSVVDTDVDEFPSDAARIALADAMAGDAMAGTLESAELFDVDVDQLARLLALVSADWLCRLESLEVVEAQAREHTADSGGGDRNQGGDLLARKALAAELGNALDDRLWRGPMQGTRPGGAISQAVGTLLDKAFEPFADGFGADPEGRGHGLRGLPLDEDTADDFGSTMSCQASILVNVHSVLSPASQSFDNFSFLGQGRVDNLLKAHT
jgi:hypothetical protein